MPHYIYIYTPLWTRMYLSIMFIAICNAVLSFHQGFRLCNHLSAKCSHTLQSMWHCVMKYIHYQTTIDWIPVTLRCRVICQQLPQWNHIQNWHWLLRPAVSHPEPMYTIITVNSTVKIHQLYSRKHGEWSFVVITLHNRIHNHMLRLSLSYDKPFFGMDQSHSSIQL